MFWDRVAAPYDLFENIYNGKVYRGTGIAVAGEIEPGEKSVSMIKQKELLPLTGYVHGGCSPIGMKKRFPTFFHDTASGYERIYFSAGKVGYQVEVSPGDISKIVRYDTADLV